MAELTRIPETPRLIIHPSFEEPNADREYRGEPANAQSAIARSGYLPDELTRDYARRMHYAAYRAAHARRKTERYKWQQRYYKLRDQIILGNHKLIFRALSKRHTLEHHTDDLLGECYLVLIRAVAAYNPWIGVRFSTYAFTCLMRALSRLGKKFAVVDAFSRTLTLDMTSSLQDNTEEPLFDDQDWRQVAEHFRTDSTLLTDREKIILKRRFSLGSSEIPTLSELGRELGVSKERVRQIEITALAKLRDALLDQPSAS